MLRIRKILLVASLLLGWGSLGATLAYAWYLHSAAHLHVLEQRVGDYLQLPVRIGAFEPGDFTSVTLRDVQAYLPDQRARVFDCADVLWQRRWVEGRAFNILELKNGRLSVGSARWQESDYRTVLESGFGHDFSDLNLERVLVWNMDLLVQLSSWRLEINRADGLVQFGLDDGSALASLQSDSINGHKVDGLIRCRARFIPGDELRLENVDLEVPRMPVAHLQLEDALHAAVGSGMFAGSIKFREVPYRELIISGLGEDLQLAELSAGLPGGPLSGTLPEVRIDFARFKNGRLQEVRFGGRLSGLDVAEWVRLLDRSGVTGRLQLDVREGLIVGEQLAELRAGGTIRDIDLEALSETYDFGTLTGILDVELRKLEIVGDRLVSAEIELAARPPEGAPAIIDRALIRRAVERFAGMALPELPFDQLEYVRLGMRLVIKENAMRVYGLYGPGRQVILSLRVLGQELPVIRAPRQVFRLPDVIARLKEQADGVDVRTILGKTADNGASGQAQTEPQE